MSGGSKYGGLVPRKKPLISKDKERAFFDSADWALCKQGAGGGHHETMAMVETLRPKLQRTQRQQLPPRRPACTSGQDNLVPKGRRISKPLNLDFKSHFV
ncbi:uncharacterized protein LOC111479518 isoform X3 [Cucurbita maxima]|nr:uncharacterized protein LOC111479518 isoform X3 [Cucurbita maxima]